MVQSFHFLSLLISISAADALATCYYPSGVTEPNHVPCNQTTTAASACCDPLDACSTSGMCLGRSGWDYRGSCTDQSRDSANCAAKKWSQCVTDPSTGSKYDGFTAIWVCSDNGLPITDQCCSYGNGSSCCGSSFQLGVTGSAFKPGVDALIQNLTTSSLNSTNSTQQSNCTITKPSNGDLGTKVGVGVGVPLGVLVAGLLGFLFYREHKNKHGAVATGAAATTHYDHPSPMEQHQMHNQVPQYTSGYQDHSNVTTPQQATYSPNLPKSNHYNPTTPVYEAAANNVHEMGGR